MPSISLKRIANFKFRPIKPYNFELTVRKPAGWSWFTPYEIWEKGTIWSGFWFGKVPIGVKASSKGMNVHVDVFAAKKLPSIDLSRLEHLLGEALGVSEDLRPFYRLIRKDRILKDLADRLYGMHEGWGMNIFSSLTLAILLQMAPIKRSEEMWHCLIERFGKRVNFDGRSVLMWPDERTISKQEPKRLSKECKLGYRGKFLVKMSKQLVKGFPGMDELAAMSSEEANDKLQELFGVGEYTAGFANPHPAFMLDVWSIKIFYPILFGKNAPRNDPRSGIPKASEAAERKWGDWRGYVLTYVLNDLDHLSKKFGIPV